MVKSLDPKRSISLARYGSIRCRVVGAVRFVSHDAVVVHEGALSPVFQRRKRHLGGSRRTGGREARDQKEWSDASKAT